MSSWLDPGTAAKVVILTSSEVLPTLLTYVDRENIPVKFGGMLSFVHGQSPDIDPGTQKTLLFPQDSEKKLPPGPLKWIVDEDNLRTVVAVGTDGGVPRFKQIAKLRQFEQTEGVPVLNEKLVDMDVSQTQELNVN